MFDETTDLDGKPIPRAAGADDQRRCAARRPSARSRDGLRRRAGPRVRTLRGLPGSRGSHAGDAAVVSPAITTCRASAFYVNRQGRTVQQILQRGRAAARDQRAFSIRPTSRGSRLRRCDARSSSFVAQPIGPALGARAAGTAGVDLATRRASCTRSASRSLAIVFLAARCCSLSPVLRASCCAGTRSATCPTRRARPRRRCARLRARRRLLGRRTRSLRPACSSPGCFASSWPRRSCRLTDYAVSPHLQPRLALGPQHDSLRALGAARRRPAAVLHQQLRRQPRELHERLHRQGGLGPQRHLQQRRRVSADVRSCSAAGSPTRRPTSDSCRRARCSRRSGTAPIRT